MKSKLAMSVGVLALLGLLGVTVAEMQAVPDVLLEQAGAQQSVEVPAQSVLAPLTTASEPAVLPAPVETAPVVEMGPVQPISPRVQRTRDTGPIPCGMTIRPDGTTVGRVTRIDRSTLSLVPVPNTLVTFFQDRKVVAQGVTDERGIFTIQGLTPGSVCSVAMSAPDWVSMFSVVIRPFDPAQSAQSDRQPTAANRAGVTPGLVNEIRFASMVPAADESAETDADGSQQDLGGNMAMVPREDFVAAQNSGALGSDAGGSATTAMSPGSGMGGGGAGGGGGGSGGGGGGGIGAGLLGGIGAGIGAALGASQGSENQASSPVP